MPDELPDLFGHTTRPRGAIAIPPDALREPCAGPTCKATVWIAQRPGHEPVTLDVQADGCFRPRDGKPGLGVLHYLTCPDWLDRHGNRKAVPGAEA